MIGSAQQVGLQGSGSREILELRCPPLPQARKKTREFPREYPKPNQESREKMGSKKTQRILGLVEGNDLKYFDIWVGLGLGWNEEEKVNFGGFEDDPKGNPAAQGLNYSLSQDTKNPGISWKW